MKKKKQLMTGLLISSMTLSTFMAPTTIYAEPLKTSLNQTQNNPWLQTNQLALDLLALRDLKQLAQWDSNLGTITQAQADEIKLKVDELIKDSKTQTDKAKTIYTWIVQNVTYGGENVGIDPYDVFTKKQAVCGGYSRLYKAMLNLAGIPSTTMAGNTPYGSHEWNTVYADNQWFYSDATFGIHGDHSLYQRAL